MMHHQTLIILTILTVNASTELKKPKQTNEFVASNDWQEIKEGQTVPSGLHYRINLSTGKKEAKILDKDEPHNPGTNFISERALRDVDKPKPAFRSMEEIKRDLGDLLLLPKTDLEILRELFGQYEQGNNTVTTLKDLQYLGHQIDNGNEFCYLDGFKRIVYKELNSSDLISKQEALKLFSVLAQNNPKVKVHVLETGGVGMLLKMLSLEHNELVKNSALTALSCTLRTFPYAQNKFIESGGLSVLTALFGVESLKLRIKIVTLLTDIIIERQQDVHNFENHAFVDVKGALIKLNWCNNMNVLLENLDLNDFDSVEKALLGMRALLEKCRGIYNKDMMAKVGEQYKVLAEQSEEDTAEYLGYLVELISELIGAEQNVRVEL